MTGGRAGESEVERLTRLRGKHPQRHRIICHPAEPVIFSKHSDCRLFHRARRKGEYQWPGDATAVAKAERRFKQLTGAGFTAAVRTAEGHSKRIRDFDPAAEETIFFPRLQGG